MSDGLWSELGQEPPPPNILGCFLTANNRAKTTQSRYVKCNFSYFTAAAVHWNIVRKVPIAHFSMASVGMKRRRCYRHLVAMHVGALMVLALHVEE